MDYTLSFAGYEAKIDADWGADIMYLRHNGQDILVPIESKAERSASPYLHGAPLLLPANRTIGGKFSFAEQEYSLPVNEEETGCHLHGLLYNKPFQTHNATELRWEGSYINSGEAYPFPYKLDACYEITERGFLSRFAITNIGNSPMPVTFGLHTTFVADRDFSVPLGEFQACNNSPVPTDKYLPLTAELKKMLTGMPSQGVPIDGYFRSTGNTARIGSWFYRVFGPFTHWVLYNRSGTEGYMCIEPQCGEVNGLNGECLVIPAGETVRFETLIGK